MVDLLSVQRLLSARLTTYRQRSININLGGHGVRLPSRRARHSLTIRCARMAAEFRGTPFLCRPTNRCDKRGGRVKVSPPGPLELGKPDPFIPARVQGRTLVPPSGIGPRCLPFLGKSLGPLGAAGAVFVGHVRLRTRRVSATCNSLRLRSALSSGLSSFRSIVTRDRGSASWWPVTCSSWVGGGEVCRRSFRPAPPWRFPRRCGRSP